MYQKLGTILNEKGSEKPILVNDIGEAYQVGHLAAYVWEKLDGRTSASDIKEELAKMDGIDAKDLESGITRIISQLDRVGLVKLKNYEATC